MAGRSERQREAFVRSSLEGSRLARVRWVAETGSTNDDLVELARSGAPEQVLITDLQTAGRGRRDRVWDAPSGSGILMSVLLRGVPAGDGFWSVGLVALAASQAIDELTVSPCRLKWPNDLVLGEQGEERKVAGVLAQVADDAVIVGIGINVNWPTTVPPVMAERGTSVNRHLREPGLVDRAALAADILGRVVGHLAKDLSSLRTSWKNQCATLGSSVRLILEDRSIVGIVTDICDDGSLQIEDEAGISVHQVGDVVHLRPQG